MKLKYDFHMHSCLSPCGDADMTPCNIVNMAKLLELDIIALTDHNTCGNCESAIEAGKEVGIPVIAGMELCTAEEIHVVCLFPTIDDAMRFSDEIKTRVPPVKNKPNVFGEQLYMDSEDKVIGSEDILLVTASSVDIYGVKPLVESFNGFCYPAHIDRPSFAIISSLGDFPPELGFTCAEVTPDTDVNDIRREYPALNSVRIMRSSDAHYLENMREAADLIDAPECTAESVIEYLKHLKNLNL